MKILILLTALLVTAGANARLVEGPPPANQKEAECKANPIQWFCISCVKDPAIRQQIKAKYYRPPMSTYTLEDHVAELEEEVRDLQNEVIRLRNR